MPDIWPNWISGLSLLLINFEHIYALMITFSNVKVTLLFCQHSEKDAHNTKNIEQLLLIRMMYAWINRIQIGAVLTHIMDILQNLNTESTLSGPAIFWYWKWDHTIPLYTHSHTLKIFLGHFFFDHMGSRLEKGLQNVFK